MQKTSVFEFCLESFCEEEEGACWKTRYLQLVVHIFN